jgi:hypothetical protein
LYSHVICDIINTGKGVKMARQLKAIDYTTEEEGNKLIKRDIRLSIKEFNQIVEVCNKQGIDFLTYGRIALNRLKKEKDILNLEK